jgi:hypothetical protein
MAAARKRPALKTQVRSALRRVWSWSPQREQALANARVAYGRYQCAQCSNAYGPRAVAVDHVLACGGFKDDLSDLGDWASRLFFGELQILCDPCHKVKTAQERAARKKK